MMCPPYGFLGIEKVSVPPRAFDIETLLLRRELFCIVTLQTLSPLGLNEAALFNVCCKFFFLLLYCIFECLFDCEEMIL